MSAPPLRPAAGGTRADAVELGVFARTWPSAPAADIAASIRAAGFTATQLNLSALGRATLDPTLSAAEADTIGAAFAVAGVRV